LRVAPPVSDARAIVPSRSHRDCGGNDAVDEIASAIGRHGKRSAPLCRVARVELSRLVTHVALADSSRRCNDRAAVAGEARREHEAFVEGNWLIRSVTLVPTARADPTWISGAHAATGDDDQCEMPR
jgi:hypothetical protein